MDEGSYGKIYLMKDLNTNQKSVLKKIEISPTSI
jgi:hypothetical protein